MDTQEGTSLPTIAAEGEGFCRHLKDCTGCPDEKKNDLLKAHAEEEAVGGSAKNMRSQAKKQIKAKMARKIRKNCVFYRRSSSLFMMVLRIYQFMVGSTMNPMNPFCKEKSR